MKDYVKVWSIVMTKDSAARFRMLFFLLTAGNLILILLLGWVVWKFYPLLRENGGFKQMLSSVPFKLGPPKSGENKE
jgi:type III secretion protein J